jgi:hypothetical protein
MEILVNAAERYAGWSPSYLYLVAGVAGVFWQLGAQDLAPRASSSRSATRR